MSPPYRHRKTRPLHNWRHGWYHFTLHRNGTRHRHGRDSHIERPERRSGRWRSVPRRLWPREIGRQILAGVVLGLGLLVLLSVIFGIFAFLNARSNLTKAQDIAKQMVHNRNLLLSADGRAQAATELASMHYYANLADNELGGSVAISILRDVPLLGYQVSSITNTVHDVNVLSTQGQFLLESTVTAINASHGTAISLPKLKQLDRQVHASARTLAGLESSTSGLWGPVNTERAKLNGVLSNVVTLLRRGGDALDFAQPFLGADGPRIYLVVGENNSEMRDQGAVLSFALLHANNGVFTMDSAASVGKITLHQPAIALSELAPGTREAFGDLDPTRIWQSTNANADFPTSAKWMIAMFDQARGIHVDGVIGVDVQTLANILKVVGGVHIPAVHQEINTNNVAPLLLFDLYTKYPEGSQVARHDDITAVAQAAVDRMKTSTYDLGAFFDALAKASQGRHLLLYDTDPALERTVSAFGGSGALLAQGNQSVHLAVEAGVAAKLDWFMHTYVTYDIRIDSKGNAYITTTLILHNDAPAHAKPSYAMGPDNTNSHVAGEYIARVYEWLPPSAQAAGAISEEQMSLQRAIEPVFAQQTQEVIFTGTMLNAVHHGVFVLHFIPQSLIHPTQVTVNFSSTQGFDGPIQSTWVGNNFVTLRWTASQ
jgi:hypothetical protein